MFSAALASILRVSLSFTPGFSPVIKTRESRNRFSGNHILDSPNAFGVEVPISFWVSE